MRTPLSKKARSLAARIMLAIAASFLAVYCASLAAERWFFDKFYYRKSVAHGYFPDFRQPPPLQAFGERTRYLRQLYGEAPALPTSKEDEETYTIVVLGDSLCWGQGLRQERRWVALLQPRLDAMRPTRLIPLCEPGDQLLDHMTKYRTSLALWQADLYLFCVVGDDLLIKRPRLALDPELRRAFQPCRRLPMAALTPEDEEEAEALVFGSGPSRHRCLLECALELLPRQGALYVDYGPAFHRGKPVDRAILQPIRDAGFRVATLIEDEPSPTGKRDPAFYVSPMETHPSAGANRRFAEALFRLLSEDASLGFRSEDEGSP